MKKIGYALLAILGVGIVTGIVFLCIVLAGNKAFKIRLNEEGVTEERIEYYATGIVPGESRGYDVVLKCKLKASYHVTLVFDGEAGVLRDCIDVEIKYGEETVTNKLSDLLDGEVVEFDCDVNKTYEFSVCYIMSLDAGNEIMGAAAEFDVIVTAERTL